MKKKQVQNQAQEGRSMVEMLGVLAIIGVLSIGGIAGYRMAMNRYQANQIAHEINLMRTDAKIKVARGVGELLLGEPYDGEEGHLKFNASYGVKVESKDIFDEETNTTETGYSFTLSGISAGVCKPLATLLDSMDDTAALEINGGDYTTTENPCSETENEIEVAFSSKDLGVSGGGSGEEPGQGDEPQDDDPVPEECPRGTTRSDDESECTCEDTEKTCNGGCCAGCTGGKVWTGRKCACPAGAEESGDDGEDCVCSTATPYWDGTKCTTCPEGSNWNSETGECECEGNKVWKESVSGEDKCVEIVGECESNADCGPGEYCYLYEGIGCYDGTEFQSGKFGAGSSTRKSQCRNARKDAVIGKKTGFALAWPEGADGKYMDWWSAGRFCEALGRPQATLASIDCDDVAYNDYCQSQTRKDLYDDFKDKTSSYVWMYDMYNDYSCAAYFVNLTNGNVYGNLRNVYYYALCE